MSIMKPAKLTSRRWRWQLTDGYMQVPIPTESYMRSPGPKAGNVLYDSTSPEIRAIALDPKGTVYVAAMGGAVATRTAAQEQPQSLLRALLCAPRQR